MNVCIWHLNYQPARVLVSTCRTIIVHVDEKYILNVGLLPRL